MSRTAARIRHDEITRMVKAVQACGLPVTSVTFDGNVVRVNTVESGEALERSLDRKRQATPVKEVETL